MTLPSLSLPSRLWLSWVCAFRVLFDGQFAARVTALREAAPQPEELPAPSPRRDEVRHPHPRQEQHHHQRGKKVGMPPDEGNRDRK